LRKKTEVAKVDLIPPQKHFEIFISSTAGGEGKIFI